MSNSGENTSERSLGKQISYIGRTIRWIADRELKPTGLSTATFLLVRVIHHSPGITQNELGEVAQIDKATVAKSVAKLESLGYLSRVPDDQDGRIRRLYVTDAGQRVMPAVQSALRHVTEICTTNLTESEIAQLFDLLDRVEDAVSNYVERARGDFTGS